MDVKNRPTKKQREMLSFIDSFIAGHGYGPSYREIMRGMGYKSVATVALHVDNLIIKGHLKKRGKSARSLEVVDSVKKEFSGPKKISAAQEKWLVDLIDKKYQIIESNPKPSQSQVDELYVLTGTLKILGFEEASNSFKQRLAKVKKKLSN